MEDYEYNDISSEDEYDDDYFNDSDEEELEGGSYSLSGVDTMRGGGANKWTRFYSAVSKKGYTQAEASRLWKSGRRTASKIKPKSGSRKKSSKKSSARSKSEDGIYCSKNGRRYKLQSNYDRYCLDKKPSTSRASKSRGSKKIYKRCAANGRDYLCSDRKLNCKIPKGWRVIETRGI